jgi:hypothetical protein
MVLLIAMTLTSAPVLANGPITLPFDPIITLPPFVLDPCAGADAIFELTNRLNLMGPTGSGLFLTVYSYDIEAGGTAVGRAILEYKRYFDGTDSYVALEDTFMFEGGLSLYGRASNYKLSLIGAQGVVHQATQQQSIGFKTFAVDIPYTYKWTDADSKLEVCFWLDNL